MRRLAYLRNLADQIAAADRDWSAEISALIKARHEAIAAVTA